MSPHAYTEDQLVEQPAIGLFATLGWQTVSALDETFGAGGTSEVVNFSLWERPWARYLHDCVDISRASPLPQADFFTGSQLPRSAAR